MDVSGVIVKTKLESQEWRCPGVLNPTVVLTPWVAVVSICGFSPSKLFQKPRLLLLLDLGIHHLNLPLPYLIFMVDFVLFPLSPIFPSDYFPFCLASFLPHCLMCLS